MAIASKYAVFLPARRSLPSSLAGAVVGGVLAGSCDVEVTGVGSRAIEAEGVMGVTGASRGFSGVR
jgi:stage V sporulation protein SpoVS